MSHEFGSGWITLRQTLPIIIFALFSEDNLISNSIAKPQQLPHAKTFGQGMKIQ
jgi:hypothetical protein